jgi:hypothetical protein
VYKGEKMLQVLPHPIPPPHTHTHQPSCSSSSLICLQQL